MKNGIGRLNFEHPPEPGTVLGPNYNKELIAVLETDEHGCTMRYAQTKDFQNIREPRSVTEHAMITPVASPFGMIRTTSPYEMPVTTGTNARAHVKRVTEKSLIKAGANLLLGKGQNGR